MKELYVNQNDAGQRLDRFVAKAVPLLPSSLLQKYIRLKRIKLNGKGAKRDVKLSVGDVLQLYINDEFFEPPSEENAYLSVGSPQLGIVYEDGNILLADKKPGINVHSTGKYDYNTLIARIQAHVYNKGEWNPRAENSFAPALCNRIDRNTGGIVIAAKNAESLRVMNEKIKERRIDKVYLCVVHGKPSPAEGRISGYIFKDAKKNQVYVYDEPRNGAKTAITEYRTLDVRGGLSLVECRLITGRTHQIRAQMAHIGYPLLGDGKYGSEVKNKPYSEKSQLLYSYKLRFDFQGGAGALDYLSGLEFSVANIPFVDKYFPGTTI